MNRHLRTAAMRSLVELRAQRALDSDVMRLPVRADNYPQYDSSLQRIRFPRIFGVRRFHEARRGHSGADLVRAEKNLLANLESLHRRNRPIQTGAQKIKLVWVRRNLANYFFHRRSVCRLAQKKHTDREDKRSCRKASHVGIVFCAG